MYNPPRDLKAFPHAERVRPKTSVRGGGGRRYGWKDKEAKGIYEWDSMHGTVEAFTIKGKHLGEFDPNTGMQLKIQACN